MGIHSVDHLVGSGNAKAHTWDRGPLVAMWGMQVAGHTCRAQGTTYGACTHQSTHAGSGPRVGLTRARAYTQWSEDICTSKFVLFTLWVGSVEETEIWRLGSKHLTC